MADCDEEIRKIAYEQHYEAFRSLNQQMWQVPVLAMTLTGGLWFGAQEATEDKIIASFLLLLAGIGDVAFIVVLWRVRFIIGQILDKLREIYPDYYVDASPGTALLQRRGVVVITWSIVLGLASIASFVAVVRL